MFPVFEKGDQDPLIADVQRRLLSPTTDGYFNHELVVRVRGYQFAHHLPETGCLDERTLEMLLQGVDG